jgi:N-acetylglucosaminyldiphosphoundecaprenol N-acetyl-beta-D-mannosaminyltransferase
MGLGGSIDVWSRHTKRAPRLVRKMRLEWLWRSVAEPRRLRILWDIPAFLLAVLKEKKSKGAPQSETPINTNI